MTKTTTDLYKQTPLGLIPNDWEVKKLTEVSKIFDGTHTTPNYVADGVPFYSVEHVTSNRFDDTKFITEEVFAKDSQRVILEKGDILMTRIGDIGTTRFIDWDVRASFYVSLALIKTKEKDIDAKFLSQFINSIYFKRELYQRTIHVAFPKKINLGEIGECNVLLPPLPEQKAIAQVLSTADAAIQTTEKLIAQKELRKKWLMQQLLTGKKRLNGFEGEWKEIKIGDIGIVQTGNTPSKQEPENWGGNYNWCTSDDMKNKYISGTIQKLSYVGWKKSRIAKANSVLVTCIASIGINAITTEDTGFNQQINSITPSENFNTEFVYYLIDYSKNKLLEYAGAGALPMLNKNTFMSIEFKFPNLKEQTAIAQILQAADKEINLLKTKATKLREQKKGLMQQLLTGKKRLNLNL